MAELLNSEMSTFRSKDVLRVPWSSLDEWRYVKNKLNATAADKIRAFEILLAWKARSLKLPSSIECTIGILQALLSEENAGHANLNETLFAAERRMQLTYSTALVRFINHLSSGSVAPGLVPHSLYNMAHKQNIPDWVINLRHDVAHSSSLPPLSLLRSAVQLAEQWLLENYWNVQETEMSDVSGDLAATIGDNFAPTDKLVRLLNLGVKAWVICSRNMQNCLLHVSHMGDEDWQILKQFCCNLKESKYSSINGLVDNLAEYVQDGDKYRNWYQTEEPSLCSIQEHIYGIITYLAAKKRGRSAFFNSFLETEFLNDGSANVTSWMPLLKLIVLSGSLNHLVSYLLSKLSNNFNPNEVNVVQTWLEDLAPYIENSFVYKEKNPQDETRQSNNFTLKEKLEISVDVFQSILLQPNPSISFNLLSKYFPYAVPPVSTEKIQLLKALWDIGTCTRNQLNGQKENQDVLHGVEEFLHHDGNSLKEIPKDGPWKSAALTEDWRRTPIGLLPGQIKPELELPHLLWEKSLVK